MQENIFEQFGQKKAQLRQQVQQAREYGWIDETQYKEVLEKINGDKLTIGVIGQMKCGKSTFLNAFVFGKDVLPAATTPMTASLSVITYGEQERIVAEFYTVDEWTEQKMLAERSLEGITNNLELSKIKAAKELVGKAVKLGGNLNGLLGKTQEDTLTQLEEYVGADGKYIAITKSVTIYYPKEYLKGVEIVDTPGFNDPIVSREERTKSFLSKADVVLMMLYAGRAFDATDRDIIFKNVRNCGAGRVLVGINKYDLSYANGETEEEIRQYVKDEIDKACRECDDSVLNEILRETEPIPLSAEMALLAQLPMEQIRSNEVYNHAWTRACDTFEVSTQREMTEKSRINELTEAVRHVIEKEKEAILFAKPYNLIRAKGREKHTNLQNALQLAESKRDDLNRPDDELEERSAQLSKAERRVQKKINNFGDDLDEIFRKTVREGETRLEDLVASSCQRLRQIIDSKGRFEDARNLVPKLENELSDLVTRKLKRETQALSENAQRKTRQAVASFFDEVSDVFLRYVPDFDASSTIKDVQKRIQFELDTPEGLFSYQMEGYSDDDNLIYAFLQGATFGLLGGLNTVFSHSESKNRMHTIVNQKQNDFDARPFLNTIFEHKDSTIEAAKTAIIDELITPMREQIEEVRSMKHKKEEELAKTIQEIEQLKQQLTTIVQQLTNLGIEVSK